VFEATVPALFLDYFRIPYRIGGARPGGLDAIRHASGRMVAWPAQVEAPRCESRIGSIPVFAAVVPDAAAVELLSAVDGDWSPRLPLDDPHGRPVASIWEEPGGSVFLPFDPREAIESYWSESYKDVTAGPSSRVRRVVNAAYYRVRPAIPRAAQIALRRVASRAQARTRFPRWPVEPGLHDLYDFLFGLLGEVAREPVPWIAPWPGGYSWALVLTHDVETEVGYRHLDLLRDVELLCGRRSSWNFVPRRYAVADDVVRRLIDDGFEVGVHGLYHDGRDVSPATISERLPGIRAAAERWDASGFRAPATRRVWELMPRLGFDYDSSYPDTDPFEPDPGGCCTWLPFFNGATVELPITLPQDHTLFAILRRDESLWLEKTEELRRRGGLALLITHPDYMLEERHREAYTHLLTAFAGDPTSWAALPREVSAWWRRRAESHIERGKDGRWRIVGPAAADGRIAFAPAYRHGRLAA
jgi:hypothetical protein